jgi:hypothetical protein
MPADKCWSRRFLFPLTGWLFSDPGLWELGWIQSKLLAHITIDLADQKSDIRVSGATPGEVRRPTWC